MEQRAQSIRPVDRRTFGLGWALLLSVLIHVLLFLVGGWLPTIRPTVDAPEETVLRFSFAQPAETDETASPRGDVPFDTPAPRESAQSPPVEPSPQAPPPSLDLSDTASAPPRAEAEMGSAEQPEPALEPPSPKNDAREETEQRPIEERVDPSPVEVLAGESEPLFDDRDEAAEPSETESSQTAQRSFDLNGAIEDFGRVLDRARANAPPPDSVSGPPSNVYVPDPAELDTSGYGLGNLVFETKDFDWTDYARAVYMQIWRAWHNRLLRMTNEFEKWAYVNREPNLRHANQLRFVIERSGQVTGIMIEGPSGCVPLDDSATQALAEVILPPLPDAFPKEREVVHARFIAIGEIRYMKPVLTRMKALNYF